MIFDKVDGTDPIEDPAMRTTRPSIRFAAERREARGLERPMTRLAVTVGASVVWIAGYALVTAKAIQIL